MTTPRPWSDAEKQELLDRLRAGERLADIARSLGRGYSACHAMASALRKQGWTAAGARRRSPGADPTHRRPCCMCRTPFAPASRFIFRCDRCRAIGAGIAA